MRTFAAGSIWKHYKGGEYVIVATDDVHIFYAPTDVWMAYKEEAEQPGNECQIWARHKDQWEQAVDWNGQTVPRFRPIE